MDLNLNPEDSQIFQGFGLDFAYKFCSSGFGFDNIALNFFATFTSLS